MIWSDEVPLTAGRDPRRTWVTRRADEQYNPGFTNPQASKCMEITAWGCIAYNYISSVVSTSKLPHPSFDTSSQSPSSKGP